MLSVRIRGRVYASLPRPTALRPVLRALATRPALAARRLPSQRCQPLAVARARFASEAGGASKEDAKSDDAGSDEKTDSEGAVKKNLNRRTFYDILEVPRKAKKAEVKEAYRRLAKKYHPDRNLDDPEAETRFKEVQEAYATLKEPFKRALYDQDLQFSTYGSATTQEVDREHWTEHWDRETPEERENRRARYRRYAAGERNDLPPALFPVKWTPVLMLGTIGAIFYVCVRAPDWFDAQSDPPFCDPAHDDTSVPLVWAFHDPVMNRWERLPEGVEAPKPKELYDYYTRRRPDLMERLDLKLLPKLSLTTMLVPKTEAAKAHFRPLPAA